MAKQESNALVKVEVAYPVLVDPVGRLKVLRENLGNEELSRFDLTTIKVPTGGGRAWSIPSVENPDGEAASAIEGIIIFTKVVRAYWKNPAPTGEMPDCTSEDSIIGIGNPGGLCNGDREAGILPCPFSLYGSAKDELGNPKRGQACKQIRPVFILRPDDFLPMMVAAPPSSLKTLKRFLIALGQKGRRPHDVITKLALMPATSKDGKPFSIIQPTVLRTLAEDERERVAAYVEAIRPNLEAAARAATVAESEVIHDDEDVA